jgi:hypothetical protein
MNRHELLQFFKYDHLPFPMQAVSSPFHDLAEQMGRLLPDNCEKTASLRKLLEAKDCAVRSAIFK